MGGGIAWLMANNNMMPIMKDINVQGLELGLKQASDNFQVPLKRRCISSIHVNSQILNGVLKTQL